MARLRLGRALALSLLLCAARVVALAAEQTTGAASGLYDRPILVVDPGMHTAPITGASADAAGRWVVTGSDDKTVRVWSLADGALLRTIRLPAGPGNIGKVSAVAMSPDGTLIAVGGWTRASEADRQEQIYLFDRESGALVRRIDGLPTSVTHLALSVNGSLLAATLAGHSGLRVYARERGWTEVARDEAYGGAGYGVDFAPDGRLATTSWDGKVRLYGGDLKGNIRPVATATPVNVPLGVAFSPDGSRLAIGADSEATVALLDGRTLAPLRGPDFNGIAKGSSGTVAWSRDGRTLFAGGQLVFAGGQLGTIRNTLVLAWDNADAGTPRKLAAGQNTVRSLVPLPGSDLLIADAAPWLTRLQTDGIPRWMHGPPEANFRGQARTLSVSNDGAVIDFGFAFGGAEPARFDLTMHTLGLAPPRDGRTAAPYQSNLPVKDWLNTTRPMLGEQPLPLEQHEVSRTFAVHPSGDSFVLGTNWVLRAFQADGIPLGTSSARSAVWAVNITGDGRLVVAAYGDGTIRWHRMSDGVELLAFMPFPDRTNWVAWTPEGFYAASAGAHGVLRWHVNHGWDQPADSVPVEEIPGSYRPEVLPLVLQELETPRALGLAVLAEHNREVARRTHSQVPRSASAPTTRTTPRPCASAMPTATPATWRARSSTRRAASTPRSCRRCCPTRTPTRPASCGRSRPCGRGWRRAAATTSPWCTSPGTAP
jgi:WD40 repeat protein